MALLALAAATVAGCGQTSRGTSSPSPQQSDKATIALAGVTLVKPGTLTIGSDIPYQPQEFYDASHNPAGFDVDVGRAIADRLDLHVAFVNQDFDHIITELNNRKFDIVLSAMTITDTRSALVAFVPYFKAGAAMIVQSSSSYRPTVNHDLCGHRVGVQSSTVEADDVKAAVAICGNDPPIVQSFGTDPEGLEQLRQGHIDVEYTDSTPAAYAAKVSGGKLMVSSGIFDIAPQGIAIARSNSALASAVSRAFAELKADGTYRTLLDKWGLASGTIGS